jgi:transcriptional regulator with XRE-family HTH domain
MTLLRRVLGETLRGQRLRQRRTLREVSGAARVSLGYLSEVERGQKEASSELLASICQALDVRMSDLLREVSDLMRRAERTGDVARAHARPLVPAGVGASAHGPDPVAPRSGDGLGMDPGAFDPDRSADHAAGVDGDPRADRLPEARPPAPAENAAALDPAALESAALAAALDGTGPDGTPGSTVLDAAALDTAALDAPVGPAPLDSVGLDSTAPAGLDPSRLERFRVDVAELDGVDLAELETGDGLGEVEALLGLTDLMCRPESFGPGPLTVRLACAGTAA